MVVAEYVSAVVGCRTQDVTAVSRLPEGNRHDVFRASYRSGEAINDVVVRVSLSNTAVECRTLKREAAILRALAGNSAPTLHDARCDNPWFANPAMCMEFVPGSHIELSTATDDQIELLGVAVANVHRVPTRGIAVASESRTIAEYSAARWGSIYSTTSWVRDPLPLDVQTRLREAAAALDLEWREVRHERSFSSDEPLVLTHGDVASGNILWRPQPVLIDWEYVRVGDAADEIAYLFEDNEITTDQRKAFWRGYDPAGTKSQLLKRVAWWARLTVFGSALWWVERWVRRANADKLRRRRPGNGEIGRLLRRARPHTPHATGIADRRLTLVYMGSFGTSAAGQAISRIGFRAVSAVVGEHVFPRKPDRDPAVCRPGSLRVRGA